MYARRENGHARLLSFSGIDGAGKSTQIESLCAHLRERDLNVLVIRFWDDVARLIRIREDAGHRLFRGDKGVGTPSAPINRRDKNVRSWLMTSVRWFLYSLDVFSVRRAVRNALASDVDFVIFDRYIYDELANLTLHSRVNRLYIWLVMKFVPKLNVSYLLDADPAQARARKPEYDVEFLRINRQSYLDLSDFVGGITVLASMPIEDVNRSVLKHALKELPFGTVSEENNSRMARREQVSEE
jgi:thymidylate kinase